MAWLVANKAAQRRSRIVLPASVVALVSFAAIVVAIVVVVVGVVVVVVVFRPTVDRFVSTLFTYKARALETTIVIVLLISIARIVAVVRSLGKRIHRALFIPSFLVVERYRLRDGFFQAFWRLETN